TCTVAFTQDTILPKADPDTDELKTERYELTVKKDAQSHWSIAKSDLKDTYIGLYRGYFGDVHTFDGLKFQKEGLTVTASNGWVSADRLLGHVEGYAVYADDLKFDYTPPADTPDTSHYSALQKQLAKEHPEDIVFKPEWLHINCDATTCA